MVKKFWLKVNRTLFTFVRNLGGIYLFDKKYLFSKTGDLASWQPEKL